MLQFVTPNAGTPFLNADGTVSLQWFMFLSAIVQTIGGPTVVLGGGANPVDLQTGIASLEGLLADMRPIPPQYRVEQFIAPTLLNSWVNFGTPYNNAGYARDSLGFVYLRGVVTAGAMLSPMFRLPAGYRPANEELLTGGSRDDFGRIDILPTGDVVPKFGTNVYVSLDGLRFKAA